MFNTYNIGTNLFELIMKFVDIEEAKSAVQDNQSLVILKMIMLRTVLLGLFH